MLKNDRFLRALRRQPLDRTPIWIMRQAGRYLPEYRATREQAGDFMTLCRTPELACEVTLQPLRRFPLDAAILFSDILTIPDAMGLELSFHEGEGPIFARTIRSQKDLDALATPDPETELRYVMDAVRVIRRELNDSVPLIGFAGSPWTLATYMVEGRSNRDHRTIKTMLYQQPELLNQLLDKLTDAVSNYLLAQVAAGAQALMIFDTWGGALSAAAYQSFSLAPMKKILTNIQAKHPNIPSILFTKGGGLWLEDMAASGCSGLGLDWTIELSAARQRVGHQVALQGNLDPAVLYSDRAAIEQAVGNILASYGAGSGHVFNLGHGITPDVNPDRVSELVAAVHSLSAKFHTPTQD